MRLLKPPKLKDGDTIGIVAASLPLLPSFRESYEKGKQELTNMGFKLKEGKTLSKVNWWLAGSPKEQGEDINEMFKNKEVKAIISQTGGNSAISVLEYIDFSLITSSPKPFIGMSDITTFHAAFYAKTGLVGFHMDDVTYGMGWNWQKAPSDTKHKVAQLFKQILSDNHFQITYRPLSAWESWRDGEAEGILIGGNLHILNYLYGTSYFPSIENFNNAILFWEEENLSLYNIARGLYQLKYWGILGRIKGMIIGKVTNIKSPRQKEIQEPSLKEIVLEVLKDFTFPILANVDFGHYTVNLPMPVGLRAKFDTHDLSLSILESSVV